MADLSFTVSSENGADASDMTGLYNVLAAIDQGGTFAAIGNNYTITLAANITLTRDLPAINLDAGSTVTMLGGAHAIDGAGAFRGIPVFDGTVALDNMTIQHAQGPRTPRAAAPPRSPRRWRRRWCVPLPSRA